MKCVAVCTVFESLKAKSPAAATINVSITALYSFLLLFFQTVISVFYIAQYCAGIPLVSLSLVIQVECTDEKVSPAARRSLNNFLWSNTSATTYLVTYFLHLKLHFCYYQELSTEKGYRGVPVSNSRYQHRFKGERYPTLLKKSASSGLLGVLCLTVVFQQPHKYHHTLIQMLVNYDASPLQTTVRNTKN